MNLFATILTHPAPSANYRGESELNRSVIQKVTDGRFDYPIISPEAMRNALREMLAGYGLECNRMRLPDEEQLAVRFQDLPNPDKYIDDFLFGYLVAAGDKDRKKYREKIEKDRGKDAAKSFQFKRDSVLRMNLAKALEPYRHNAVFTQSPLAVDSPYKNADKSALLHRETCVTAFQYPFALAGNDCKEKPDWTRKLLRAISELGGVAGNHARSYFEMAPASIVVRLTDSLVAGFRTYCFRPDGHPHLIDDILHDDYPGSEFVLGGELVKRDLSEDVQQGLRDKGVTLLRDPRKLLEMVAERFLGEL
ncbi:CRISPR-associated protein Cas7/Cst2/DevR [Planctomycetes bacterium Pan216]|uniref:CRISPR-associated protein Cas7/Cst2/DevR n=1 Tax=Kolteria novifilia TaxID=2527975 RepID=A0A518B229_9BACT|nr:CRISPR-associated protein Cas7/Cst2/DevR [Planctomycetes bacterium Pan216]